MTPSTRTAPAGTLVTRDDDRYPVWLRAIPDPPAVLHCNGLPEPQDRQAVAIVGSRRATSYGLRITETLARELSGAGFTIVSGFARGIDAAAHRATLESGGRTIAVLGCGLDVDYPPGHARLQEEIAGCGAVVTEFAPGTPPLAHHFPQRNRIISGLSLGVIVIEAAEDSGSLITARLALEQGREVFAVPGSIDAPLSRGPHGLIKQGAKLTETVDDIIEELLPQLESPLTPTLSLTRCNQGATGTPGRGKNKNSSPPSRGRGMGEGEFSKLSRLSTEERLVFEQLSRDPLHLDDLTERSGLTPAAVAGILLGLELKGAVRQLPGQRYYRIR